MNNIPCKTAGFLEIVCTAQSHFSNASPELGIAFRITSKNPLKFDFLIKSVNLVYDQASYLEILNF